MINKIKTIINKFLQSFSTSGLPFIIGMLGAVAGQEFKWLRRFLIPIIFTMCALIETKNLWAILLMSIIGFLSLGYGEKAFLRKLFKQNNYLTKGFIGLLLSLSFLIVPILKGNWLYYIVGSLGIILTWAIISHQGFGEFKINLFGKKYNVLKVDFFCYSILGICGIMIIFKG